ncbi:CaiB/BaiF CoA transferase family protein [Gordonia hydrophobica]|uniref:CoA transferase n=1 Tax=Gordonia hydrophobica TaxID=40516 RepID=A0ABZ2U1D6_9ACTN|nr:CoA transferase [Gordonia hydrophobica]MBM7368476.1 crotonobetainyl-CoA:carnitine CoA-transferase CaiB-like acyl-CoA transferase [Gordonia hydrophobica]
MTTAPLDGVRVIDFGQFIAAPAATQALADLGADVIKIEPLHGESARVIGTAGKAMLQNYNRGKRAITLDLKSADGLAIAKKLVAGADIVVQNLRPGVMESFGLGAEQVLAEHPAMIYATVSGFGLHGPSKDRPGLDIAAQAESGLMWVTGEADGEPQKVGSQIIDAATGYVCAQAILGAYVGRLRTGVGDTVEVSLLEVAVHMQATGYGQYLLTGQEPKRRGNGQDRLAPAADVMTTKDGSLVLSAYSQPHFVRLCTLIGRPDLPEDPRFADNEQRVKNRAAMLTELRSAFSTMTRAEAMALLTSNGVVAGQINTYADVMRSEDVSASGLFVEVSDVDGETHTALGSPWHLGSMVKLSTTADPGLGQHTSAVLRDLGYEDADIDRLSAAGVVSL